jgi:hypothetical protein
VRIELVEKLVFGLAVLAILAVAGLVGFFTFGIQQSSGISREEVNAGIEVNDWLADARNILLTGHVVPHDRPLQVDNNDAPGTAPAPGQAPARTAVPGKPDHYIVRDGDQVSKDKVVPQIPWILKQPGVVYMPLRTIAPEEFNLYQGFHEVYEEALKGSGEFVDGKYRITSVDPSSALATRIGIQQGDEIISVNGHPVGNLRYAQGREALRGQGSPRWPRGHAVFRCSVGVRHCQQRLTRRFQVPVRRGRAALPRL